MGIGLVMQPILPTHTNVEQRIQETLDIGPSCNASLPHFVYPAYNMFSVNVT
jgi:hypothetical protein